MGRREVAAPMHIDAIHAHGAQEPTIGLVDAAHLVFQDQHDRQDALHHQSRDPDASALRKELQSDSDDEPHVKQSRLRAKELALPPQPHKKHQGHAEHRQSRPTLEAKEIFH
jgi:hypothetical protein